MADIQKLVDELSKLTVLEAVELSALVPLQQLQLLLVRLLVPLLKKRANLTLYWQKPVQTN